MAQSSYTLDTALLNATLLGNTFTGNTTVFMSLYSVTPTGNTGGTEITGNGYSRQTATFTTANNVATLSGNVVFTASGGSWASVVAAGVVDAPSAGNLLYFNTLPTTKTVASGYTLTFPTGNVTITLGST
jgi:hypothetical protein